LGYELKDREILVRFPEGTRDFSVLQNVKTGSGLHPVFYSVAIGDIAAKA
jgi:hypothetical protein